MSAPNHHDPHHDGHAGDGHGHDHDDDDMGMGHLTVGGYLTGFIFSIILTGIPFWLVMNKVIASSTATAIVILAFAAVQIVVHMVYFLHMNAKAQGGWTLMAFIFTLVLVGITLSGSLWVMYHLQQNMMPMSPQQMRTMP